MIVRSIGNSLMVILPDLIGKKITHRFDLVRPLIAFKFQSVSVYVLLIDIYYRWKSENQRTDRRSLLQILNRTNNIFELVSVEPVLAERPSDRRKNNLLLSHELDSPEDRTLRLKGAIYIQPIFYIYITASFFSLSNDDKCCCCCYRSDDLHGQLENDDVPRHTGDARFARSHRRRPLHKRSIAARFQQVTYIYISRPQAIKCASSNQRFEAK